FRAPEHLQRRRGRYRDRLPRAWFPVSPAATAYRLEAALNSSKLHHISIENARQVCRRLDAVAAKAHEIRQSARRSGDLQSHRQPVDCSAVVDRSVKVERHILVYRI